MERNVLLRCMDRCWFMRPGGRGGYTRREDEGRSLVGTDYCLERACWESTLGRPPISRFSTVRHFLSIWMIAERRAALLTNGIYENDSNTSQSPDHVRHHATKKKDRKRNPPEQTRSRPVSTQQDSSTRSKSRATTAKSPSPSSGAASDPSDHPR